MALQLQENRAREEAAKVQREETKKRAREVAVAEEFDDCEKELRTLWVEIGKVINPLGSAMQGAVAHLKAAARV